MAGRDEGGVGAAAHRRSAGALAAAAGAALALAACDPSHPDIDGFPIALDSSAGPIFVRASIDDGEAVPAVIDTLSPKTAWLGGGSSPGRRRADLTIWNQPPGDQASVPRARFGGVTVFHVDPCGGESPCLAGSGDLGSPFEAIVGSDVLSGVAAVFDLGAGELRLYPDIALGNAVHAEMCKAVFRQPFAGGGTLVVGGAEESFEGRRTVLGACMAFDESPVESQRGANALLLLSTGVGPTILGESAYARYRARTGATPASDLPTATIHLPSGPVRARIGEVTSLALAGEESAERGPCKEIYTHRLMRRDACRSGEVDSCPCPLGLEECRAGAIVDLGGDIEVAVIPDDHPVLQSLRSELRPAFPDVDGILGASALDGHVIELDYPNNRLLFSCAGDADCATYPAIGTGDARDDVAHCFPAE